MGDNEELTVTIRNDDQMDNGSEGKTTPGLIIGIVGGAVALVLVVVIILLLKRKRQR